METFIRKITKDTEEEKVQEESNRRRLMRQMVYEWKTKINPQISRRKLSRNIAKKLSIPSPTELKNFNEFLNAEIRKLMRLNITNYGTYIKLCR